MRGHAGWHRVAGHHTGWHWGGRPVVADPGWVLNLERGDKERKVTRVLGEVDTQVFGLSPWPVSYS